MRAILPDTGVSRDLDRPNAVYRLAPAVAAVAVRTVFWGGAGPGPEGTAEGVGVVVGEQVGDLAGGYGAVDEAVAGQVPAGADQDGRMLGSCVRGGAGDLGWRRRPLRPELLCRA